MADNFNLRTFLTENKLTKNAQILKEGSDYGFEVLMDAVDDLYAPGTPEHDKLVGAVEQAMHNGEIDMSEFGDDNSAPSRAVDVIANEIGLGLEEGTEEEVPENPEDYTKQPGYVHETLTAKERRLVEMVQDALGLEGYGDDNVNIQRDKEGLPRQQGPTYSEGEDSGEMAEETVIPEYNTIDELMREIDLGTNKIAEEYKIKKMKDIAEALRAKVKNLEEGEYAKHMDQKGLKQMSKDIAALEKTAAKLQGVFDKRFNKKEKTAPKKEKEETVEALQEGTFDLRKFLVENRK